MEVPAVQCWTARQRDRNRRLNFPRRPKLISHSDRLRKGPVDDNEHTSCNVIYSHVHPQMKAHRPTTESGAKSRTKEFRGTSAYEYCQGGIEKCHFVRQMHRWECRSREPVWHGDIPSEFCSISQLATCVVPDVGSAYRYDNRRNTNDSVWNTHGLAGDRLLGRSRRAPIKRLKWHSRTLITASVWAGISFRRPEPTRW